MSIGKLQAALAAATNEVTVAAANINFDFTLVKYEAPREYQHIGGLLSTKRKRDAESGTAHITARRLGSLFEDVCPPTPNLIKAYGKRASEIAELAGSKDTGDYSKSIFGSYSGVDATSIWAAATSSKAALPVHLLSCMLARVFEAPEAISIWVELVKEQRHNISKRLEDGESLPFSLAAAAAQQEISRTQLAEWDSSARSWLRTADSIKERKQTQLRLVLENINLPVNDKTVVFASVVDAWKAALTTMENLVSGAPQAVTDGAAIVGLSAWHLYPDMTVFGPKITEISMKDELIQTGGVLSLGLSSSTKETSPGVYWCLSLTFMRYYGQPVRSERQLLVNPKRITFPQFQIAVLGTVLGTWKIPLEHTRICIEILFALGSQFKKLSNMRLQDRWVEVITQPASTYLDAKGEEKEIASRLIHLDRRRASDFIPPSSTCPDLSVFNLLDTQVLFRCLKDNEGRISLLRRIAARYPNLSEESTLLRCRYDDDGNSDPDSTLHETTSDTEHEGLVEPRSEVDSEADSDEVLEDYSEPGSPASEPASQSKMEIDESELQKPAEEITMATKTVITTYATAYPRIPSFVQGSAFSNIIANDEHHHRGLPVTNSREMFVPEEESAHEYSPGTFWGNDLMAVNYHHERLEFFFGSTTSVAMFVKQRDRNWMELPAITYDDISWCLQHELFSMEKLERLITNWHSPIYETLSLLSVATTIYATLRDATVNVECLNSPLPKTNIGKHVISESFSRHKDAKYRFPRTVLTRSSAMGLVAYFEGANDIDISQLEEVMAISAGDSIYVPKRVYIQCFSRTLRMLTSN